MIKLPETITETLIISICDFTGDAVLTSYQPSGNVLIGTAEVTVDVPQLTQLEINQNQIAALTAKADEIKAKAAERLKEISDQIQQLKCLEHNPADEDV